MDLKEFVTETLLAIAGGVADAQKKGRSVEAVINPQLKQGHSVVETSKGHKADMWKLDPDNLKGAGLLVTQSDEVAALVEFDVAVTIASGGKETSEKEGAKEAGARIQIVSASISSADTKAYEMRRTRTDITRVKFAVPVRFRQGR